SERVQGKSILGQSRAQSALQFGVAMRHSGYNIFVMGDSGTGRLSMILTHLDQLSTDQETPPDYAYVDNFENTREPIALEMPAGHGQVFVKDIENLVGNLLSTFPAAFESPGYQQKKTIIERSFNQNYNTAVDLVEKQAQEKNMALYRGNGSITFAPIRENKSLDEEQFTQLPQNERDVFHSDVEKLEEYLADVLLELPQWRREMVEKIRLLDSATISSEINSWFDELNRKYLNIDDVISYLSVLKEHLSGTIIDFLGPEQPLDARDNKAKRVLLTEQYVPNLLVGHKQDKGAPVIYESHPTHQNLFGKIEYISEQGTLVTSYRRICPGSLHRANGGYLILDAEKILTYPFVWDGLKRALKSGRIEIESPYSELGISTITLKPEVILLNVKVILLGSREIYYLLQDLDGEFNEMFRVLADFDNHIQRTDES
ncbi:MAG: AAA family ATPase, partial [Methylococcales bacterium]|nr:AAA family ATPase [Methylococcales bacterium]